MAHAIAHEQSFRPSALPQGMRQLLVLIVLLVGTAAHAAIPEAERAALLDLHASTNGTGWLDDSGWGGAVGTECAWFGVTCDKGETTVEQLLLYDNNLVGPLPSTLNSLVNIKLLFLGNNLLTGEIPPLSGLFELRDLALGSNDLEGTIPSIDDLDELRTLDLGNNQLSGPIPELSGSRHLVGIDLSDNLLTGTLPGLSDLIALEHINVSDNLLSGTLQSLAGLSVLQSFQVAANFFDGPPPTPPSPSALVPGASMLCPNDLDAVASAEWDAATGVVPWYLDCVSSDVIFQGDFELLP